MSRYLVLAAALVALPALAETDQELAMATLNPVAALISVPLQFNYDDEIGPARQGERWQLNIQPVIPFSLNENWNLISRTILPVVRQEDVFPGAGTQSGLGDTLQSLFLSPAAPTASGWIWGAGPVFLLPTGASDLSTEKWGIGPTAVALKQQSGWTYGALANHVWSVAGDDDRRDISATFLQPFLSFTTPTFTSFTVNSESLYDWESDAWSVPVNLIVSQLVKLGGQPLSLALGARYWVESPDGVGPEGWGYRFTMNFLFPK